MSNLFCNSLDPHWLAELAGASFEDNGEAPIEVISRIQQDRIIVQDFCPFPQSIEWHIGQKYFKSSGNKAFLSDREPVPYVINNDGSLSSKAAKLVFASALEADQSGRLESEIWVLELGIGVGLFARFFLDAFEELCDLNGKDYYNRLRYVAGDYSEQMLLDACKHGVFCNHPGRYALCVVDALQPVDGLIQGMNYREGSAPFRAVFLNYLLDCLPVTVLKCGDNTLSQLCARTSIARGIDLAEYTDLSPQEIIKKASSSNPSELEELQDVFGVFSSDFEFRPDAIDSVPYAEFAVGYAQSEGKCFVWHNFGALQSLDALLGLVPDDGFVLVNDYGHKDPADVEQFEHQRFSNSIGVGVNFSLLRNYFLKSRKCCWLEPADDNGSIYTRLLGCNLSSTLLSCFRELFSKDSFEADQEPAKAARACRDIGRFEASVSSYRRAIERQPRNWPLMNEISIFFSFELGNPEAGAAMAKAALALNPSCSPELWNTLGDSLFALGQVNEAHFSYSRALEINPRDVRACFNLSFVYLHNKDYSAALSMIADALSFDYSQNYKDKLLQKQTEILAVMSQQYRIKCQLSANRINQCPPSLIQSGERLHVSKS